MSPSELRPGKSLKKIDDKVSSFNRGRGGCFSSRVW